MKKKILERRRFSIKRKRMLPALAASLLLTAAVTGCGGTAAEETAEADTGSDASEDTAADESGSSTEAELPQTDEDMFTERDKKTDYDEDSSVRIELNGSTAAASSDSVKISGTTVTITEEATYIISGTLDDGMIIVDAPDTAKLQIVLDGAEINSETSAALYVLEADKVFVTLADGTENTLSNGGTFTAIDDNNIDAALFSKQDLTLNGSGSLTVTSPAGHGIVGKDDLVITGGVYIVTAASHGIDANDSVRVTGETELTIDAGKDGIHAENNDDAALGFVYISGGVFDIASEGEGISAGAWLQIEDGTIDILAGGGSENGASESSDSWGGFMEGGTPGQRGGSGRPGSNSGYGSGGGAGSSAPSGNSAGSADNMSLKSTDVLSMTDIAAADMASSDGADSSDDSSEDSSTSMKGIKCESGMLISDGTITIDSADDSIHSNTSITVNGGTFEIASGDDAFHADDTLTVTAGTINISESYEGLEALHVDVQGGDITLVASDDGLNAAGGTDSSGTEGGRDGMFGGGPGGQGGGMSSSSDGTITISGGSLYVNASGDGIDANGSVTISGGYTVVAGPTQGDTSTLDYDTTAVITGGTFIGTGAVGMAQSFSDSEQGVVAVSVSEQTAGTAITLEDQSGNTLISYTPELSYAVVILSSPDLVSGETYTLTVGELSGEVEAA